MAIILAEEATSVSYTVTTPAEDTFAIPFTFLSDDDLVVKVDGVLETNLTITGAGVVTGMGTREIVLDTAVSNATVLIMLVPVLYRQTSFPEAQKLNASKVDEEFDRVFMAMQYFDAELDRAIVAPASYGALDLSLPAGVSSAGYIKFDGSQVTVENSVSVSGVLNVPGSTTSGTLPKFSTAGGDTLAESILREVSGQITLNGDLLIPGTGDYILFDSTGYIQLGYIKGAGASDFQIYNLIGGVMLRLDYNATNVNYPFLSGGTTGNPIRFEPMGSNTNIGLTLAGKGTGLVKIETPADEIRDAIWAATDDVVLTTRGVNDSLLEVTLTDASTIAVDFATFTNAVVTLNVAGATRALGTPTNVRPNHSGIIRVIQDGSGSRALTLNSGWETAAGAGITLSTGAGDEDLLFWYAISSSRVFVSLVKDILP